ncbi:MAG: BatA domain-containing protein [Elsteraceae bacterium]
MLALGSLAFLAPWFLTALIALPAIWLLLRVTPPAPRLLRFPAIRLLFDLTLEFNFV